MIPLMDMISEVGRGGRERSRRDRRRLRLSALQPLAKIG
jgi:hypothetical protein